MNELLTVSLHILTVESLESIIQTGPFADCLGAWVERMVGDMVRMVKKQI